MRRWQSLPTLLEGLVDAEVADLKAERIHTNELVRHMVPQRKIDLGDECLAGTFLPGPRRVQKLLKADGSLVRRLGQFAETDVLNDDVDLVSGRVREERFEPAALLVLGDRGVSQSRVEEEQGVGIFALHRCSQAAEMLHDELREEVPHLWRLRRVARRIVLNRLRPSDIVDSDDQRLDLGVLRGRVKVEAEQS